MAIKTTKPVSSFNNSPTNSKWMGSSQQPVGLSIAATTWRFTAHALELPPRSPLMQHTSKHQMYSMYPAQQPKEHPSAMHARGAPATNHRIFSNPNRNRDQSAPILRANVLPN